MYLIVETHFILCLLLSNDKFCIHFGGSLEWYKLLYIHTHTHTHTQSTDFISYFKKLVIILFNKDDLCEV